MDSEILSRIQFAFTIGFHILFPSFNLGLALFLVITEALWLITKNILYLSICKFWSKIFAITFGVGVVSGIVLSYEVGTNFAPYTEKFGNILGVLFAYEVLTAFFLEAGFLGIMLFGWNKVGKKLHFLATILVMIGTTVSAFWIMSANSWMQTPAGFIKAVGEDVYMASDWVQVIFNPSFVLRLIHMLLAAYISTNFVIAGIASLYLWQNRYHTHVLYYLKYFLLTSTLFIPLQIYIGHQVGVKVHEYQPIKTAAIEGLWQSQNGAPLILFAWPNQSQQKNNWEFIKIPKLGSYINTGHWDAKLIGLDAVSIDEQPMVLLSFYAFRFMVGIGIFMLILVLQAWIKYLKGSLLKPSIFHMVLLLSIPLGFIAIEAGWVVAESGRQPWVVYHLLKTSKAISHVKNQNILFSLISFIMVYAFVFTFYMIYLIKMIKQGPMIEDHINIEEHAFHYMSASTKGLNS